MTIEGRTGNHVHHNPDRIFPEGHRETLLDRVNNGEVAIVVFKTRPRPDNRLVVRVERKSKNGGIFVEPLEETEHLNMVDTPGKRVGLSGNTRVLVSNVS